MTSGGYTKEEAWNLQEQHRKRRESGTWTIPETQDPRLPKCEHCGRHPGMHRIEPFVVFNRTYPAAAGDCIDISISYVQQHKSWRILKTGPDGYRQYLQLPQEAIDAIKAFDIHTGKIS